MDVSRIINTACIAIGGGIAIYAQAGETQNTLILSIGIALLVFGIYRTSRNIPSKYDTEAQETPYSDTETDTTHNTNS